jgi:glycine/sarcosine N-methyltransferase
MDAKECYDELASHYHLIFENWEASVERQAAVLGPILERECGKAKLTRVLDCACGIGTQALGLAKLGFRVSGCDVSRGAVERARLEASRRGLELQLSGADMLDLGSLEDSGFDAVVCLDNALPHLESAEQLFQAATQIRRKLRPKGLFMASIRDYDRLIQERPAVQGPWFYSDQGQRRIVFQIWDWLDERRYTFHLYVTREVGKEWTTFHTAATYRAVLRDELADVLRQAGFNDVRWLLPVESGFFQPLILARTR